LNLNAINTGLSALRQTGISLLSKTTECKTAPRPSTSGLDAKSVLAQLGRLKKTGFDLFGDNASSAAEKSEIAQTASLVESDQVSEMTKTSDEKVIGNIMLKTGSVILATANLRRIQKQKPEDEEPQHFSPDVPHVTDTEQPVADALTPPVIPQIPPPLQKTAEEHEAARLQNDNLSEQRRQQTNKINKTQKNSGQLATQKFRNVRSPKTDWPSDEEIDDSDVLQAARELSNQFDQANKSAHNPSRNASTSSSKREMLDQISDRPIIID